MITVANFMKAFENDLKIRLTENVFKMSKRLNGKEEEDNIGFFLLFRIVKYNVYIKIQFNN